MTKVRICGIEKCRWASTESKTDPPMCTTHYLAQHNPYTKPIKPTGFIFGARERHDHMFAQLQYDMQQFHLWFAVNRPCKCVHPYKCHKESLDFNRLFRDRIHTLWDEQMKIINCEINEIVKREPSWQGSTHD